MPCHPRPGVEWEERLGVQEGSCLPKIAKSLSKTAEDKE